MQKRVFVWMVLVATVCSVYGQTERGRLFLAGSSSFSYSGTDSNAKAGGESQKIGSETSVKLTSSLGGFVANGLVIGGMLEYNTRLTRLEEGVDTSITTVGFGPFAKYYMGTGNVKPFLQGEIGIGYAKIEDESYLLKTYGVGFGMAIFINQWAAFEVGAGIASATHSNDDVEIEASGFVISAGVSLFF